MPRSITYSLRLDATNSDGYYRAIADFVTSWMPCAVSATKEIIDGFQTYRMEIGKPARSDEEYALELLTLGVLLRQGAISTSCYPPWKVEVLARLVQSQERCPRLEPAIKKLRGLIQGVFLVNPENRREGGKTAQMSDLSSLIRWLQAQGEASVMNRLAQWQEYLQTTSPTQMQEVLDSCLALAERFKEESDHALGEYSAGVQTFLAQTAPKHRWCYDLAFVSRTRLEYQLGMLATEVLNRAYRQRFLNTRRKVVIVPPCMREQPDEDCKAIETPLGARCQACKPTCRVHQITKMGEKYGFEVFIIPDELRGIGAEVKGSTGSLGLVGVSCALTNWSGGWDAEEMGIPAQGLLLDYVGCRYHWEKQGISTDTNLAKLQEIVGITSGSGE